jgi:hypothetical protein
MSVFGLVTGRVSKRPLGFVWNNGRLGRGALGALQALIDSLFGAGEQGAVYVPMPIVLGAQALFQDSAGTVPVTADGDPVGRMLDQSGNGNHATQSVSGRRPVYRTDGVLHRLAFDLVGDEILIPVNTFGIFDYFMAYEPLGNDFIITYVSGIGTGWVGIGQSGSVSSALSEPSVGVQNSIRFDEVLSAATTRGGQYSLGQDASRVLVNYDRDRSNTVAIGLYSQSAPIIGDMYGYVLRSGTMNAQQRTDLDNYYKIITP